MADKYIQFMQEYALDRDYTTLSRHVLQQQSFSPQAQDLSATMSRISLAAKLIARRPSKVEGEPVQ